MLAKGRRGGAPYLCTGHSDVSSTFQAWPRPQGLPRARGEMRERVPRLSGLWSALELCSQPYRV